MSELSILLLPLDVANRAACADAVVLSACNFALPMLELWTAVYMMMLILIVFVVPFTLFYYEQDHDMSVRGKLVSSSWWVAGTFVILGLILGLSYGFAGFVDLPVTTLSSGIAPFGASSAVLGSAADACVKTGTFPASTVTGYACDASSGVPTETWSSRTGAAASRSPERSRRIPRSFKPRAVHLRLGCTPCHTGGMARGWNSGTSWSR